MFIKVFKQAHSSNYTKGRKLGITNIVIHYVGAEGSAEDNLNYFQGVNKGASAHYFVDHAPAAQVFQSVLEQDTAWHAGNWTMNQQSLGVELCCHKDEKGNWYFDSETVDSAVNLVKELMKKYNIDISRVIRHYDVTGKNCPEPWVKNLVEWEKFKARLVEEEKEDLPSCWAKEVCDRAVEVKLIEGDGKGFFGWQEPLTLERFLMIRKKEKELEKKGVDIFE